MDGAEKIIEVTDESFEFDVIKKSHEKPVVVDFWAPWCGPCRMLGPILERAANNPALDFVLAKINVDENPNIAMRYRVQSIPAVKAFVDGRVADEFVGALSEAKVQEFIQGIIPNEADLALRAANSFLATRHWIEAEEAYREILVDFPNFADAGLNLAKALLAQAQGCEAQELLERCRNSARVVSAERLLPLANYLCRYETEPEDLDIEPIEALYRHAGFLLKQGNLEAAMDGLLEVLRQDKTYKTGEAKDVMLALFELLGDGDPLTQAYRSELASVLF
ncbi:MAG: thioredoxin [Candidatus Promineifilaceae bacterium]|nr:thioredoxin [Candidatus Promineifilaceae bacterium]